MEQGVCSGGPSSPVLSRVSGGQWRESRGCRGSWDQAETGHLPAPPRASGRGRRPSPAVGLWRHGRGLGPTAWAQVRPPSPPRARLLSRLGISRGCPPRQPSGPPWHLLVLVSVCCSLGGSWGDRNGGLAQSTKCQHCLGANRPSAHPHCVTKGSRGAAVPKARGARAGPLWAAPSWRASSPVLSPGESTWTNVTICLGLSSARGDLAAELRWGWGEAEDEGLSDPLQAPGLAWMAVTWLSSEAILRPLVGWGAAAGGVRGPASQPPSPASQPAPCLPGSRRQESFGACGSGCLPSTPTPVPPGALGRGRPPGLTQDLQGYLWFLPSPRSPESGPQRPGGRRWARGHPESCTGGTRALVRAAVVTVRLGRARAPPGLTPRGGPCAPSDSTSCAVYTTPPTVGGSDTWPGSQQRSGASPWPPAGPRAPPAGTHLP